MFAFACACFMCGCQRWQAAEAEARRVAGAVAACEAGVRDGARQCDRVADEARAHRRALDGGLQVIDPLGLQVGRRRRREEEHEGGGGRSTRECVGVRAWACVCGRACVGVCVWACVCGRACGSGGSRSKREEGELDPPKRAATPCPLQCARMG